MVLTQFKLTKFIQIFHSAKIYVSLYTLKQLCSFCHLAFSAKLDALFKSSLVERLKVNSSYNALQVNHISVIDEQDRGQKFFAASSFYSC